MDRFYSKSRLIAFSIFLLVLVGVYVSTLYKLQIVEGQAYYESSTNSIVTTERVVAARGDILDRYGRVLVSNRTSNNIVIDTDELFAQDDPNAIILELIRIVQSEGEKHTDTMPITTSPPFEYVENMTNMQRTFLNGYLLDENRDDLTENSSAVDLLAYCRDRYDIDNNYTGEEARLIAGVRYEINGRFSVATADYVFASDVNIDLITKLLESDLPGFDIEVAYIREYNTDYAAHILGYVGAMTAEEYERYDEFGYAMDSLVGKEGAELVFEEYLHGVDGLARVTTTSTGVVTNTSYIEEPQPGNHIYLTLDIGIQEAAEQSLAAYIENYNAQLDEKNEERIANGEEDEVRTPITGGSVVVIKANSGEPLAIANYPTFNPSTVFDNYSELLEDENNPLYNRALNGLYEPGSTFKPVTSLAALGENVIQTTTTIYDEGIYTKYAAPEQGSYAPTCWIYGEGSHGDVNVTSATSTSCNYFYYSVGDMVGLDAINNYARTMGWAEPSGIELPETIGTLTTEEFKLQVEGKPLYVGDTLMTAIGQGLTQTTPLQLANFSAIIANGGTRYSTSILRSVRNYTFSESIYTHEAEVVGVVTAEEHDFEAVRAGMYSVANDFTGTSFQTFGYYEIDVAAKTGTAQQGEGITNDGLAIIYAPAVNPEIAISIIVEKGGAGSEVDEIAIPILDYYFSSKNGGTGLESEMQLLK